MKTPWLLAASSELAEATPVAKSAFRIGSYGFALVHTASTVWMRVARASVDLFALRVAFAPDGSLQIERAREDSYNIATSYGRVRLRVTKSKVVRITTWIAPAEAISLTNWPRDLVFLTERGTVHTRQRGLRSGILYVSAPELGSLMYFQNYSSLSDYFDQTKTSPADCIGGVWPEVGFALPATEDHPMPASRELCTSDILLRLSPSEPIEDGELAAEYLDHLGAIYSALERPQPEYHDWPTLAEDSLRSLTFSPQCALHRNGRTYLAPYVGDESQPPESMVQLTVLLPLLEYSAWSGVDAPVAQRILEGLPSFFDAKTDCLLRWLDGQCPQGPPDVRGSPRYMDSWYLYHALFNLGRLVKRTGNAELRNLLQRSLAYARRVAHRFEYRFPVFFNLDSLEIYRAEAREGAGGENDVCGLYALVMLQAHDIFGDRAFVDEARAAAERLRGLGFGIAYQMNTTGFAAEAMLKLYLLTGEKQYLGLSYLCLANVLDNARLWDCKVGAAKEYSTFFGIFPLPDAPYLAAYEELENAAKFREYLRLANDDVAPSVRLLLAEYCRYTLDRAWYFFPQHLPRQALSDSPKSGCMQRGLAIPVEDLRDGAEKSGQVGQEIYGAGMAPGLVCRHYSLIESWSCWLFCDYPAFDLRVSESSRYTTIQLHVAGDSAGSCSVRSVPIDVRRRAPVCTASIGRKRLRGAWTSEGHWSVAVPGGASLTLRLS
ncbi:MAG: hypothetical protein JO146_00310 [Candidatus Eremiobacteraeota bacterium]|nr:hypothetical protein [Candidatus Eremiobacteraeota bacterium]